MDPTLFIFFCLWTYPILASLAMWLAKEEPLKIKRILFTVFTIAGITAIGLIANVSTTSETIDWFLITSIYFAVCLLLAWTWFQPNRIVKRIGIFVSICIFGVGYLSATAGVFGLVLTVEEYDVDREIKLNDGLIYKEMVLEYASLDYRVKRIEIYKAVSWLPFIEYRTQYKTYNSPIACYNKLTVDYKPEANTLLLSASILSWHNQIKNWSDTIVVK